MKQMQQPEAGNFYMPKYAQILSPSNHSLLCWSCSVSFLLGQAHMFSFSGASDSWWSHGLWPARLLCSWDFFPGKNTGVGCHFLLQGIFLTQESNPHLPYLLHCRKILYKHWAMGKSFYSGRFSLNLQPLGWVLLLWGLPRSVLAFKTDFFLHHDPQGIMSFLKAEIMSSHSPLWIPSTCLEAWHKLGAQCMFVKYATL